MNEFSQAMLDVVGERRRQVEVEGWTPRHDDGHASGELARAAACYADPEPAYAQPRVNIPVRWPWAGAWWKPLGHDRNFRGNVRNTAGRRRDLVRAGALIIAEIERLDRAEAAKGAAE